jgi:hypothetical protein
VIPASTLKLITGSVALDVLGSETRFVTKVQAEGRKGARVERLYLVGGGDPLLATQPYLDALRKAGKHVPEPATSLDPELMGSLSVIGIIKGKPFAPDERMKKILTEALAVANATSRSLFMNPRDPTWYYYPGSAWLNPLFVTGSEFETPIPMITREGAKPFPPTGYRTLDARTMFFYGITGISPAMSMRLTGIGSQYLFVTLDADKQYFDGAKTYKVTLPKGIPEEKFWSFTVYDNQTRSMLDTPQRYPRAGSQSYPSPAAEPDADGSTTVYFSPTQPTGIKRGDWIQTDPKKGWFAILRLYSPLEPFFTKAWRPSEITLER